MSVRRHTIYNIAGSIVPIFVAIITVPAFLDLIGETRYGILSLVWTFLGYFGLFDPGLSRAASYHIARLHDGPSKDRESVFWTAIIINLVFGIVGGIVLYLLALPFFASAFKMPDEMRGEVMASLGWLSLSVPISILSGVLGGALQAREQFALSNALSVLNAVLTQATPLGVAFFHGPDLGWLIPAILLARALGAIPNFVAVARTMPLGVGGRFDRKFLRPLFTYGGWITISNLVAPLLTTVDRIMIGSMLGVQAVGAYTVSFSLASKASVIPSALGTSLFPRLSRGSRDDSARLANEAATGIAALMTALMVPALILLPAFMRLWVGEELAAQATPIAIIIMLGVWVNGLASVPFTHLLANDRPAVAAIFHLLELVPFLAALWLGIHFFGLVGAACAWSARVTIDAILLFWVSGQTGAWRRRLPGMVLLLLSACCAPSHISSYQAVVGCVLSLLALGWSWHVSPALRALVMAPLR